MPTKNPRINLSMPPELYELINRLGKVSGKSMSASIVELLEASRPVLERVVVVGETARKIQQEAKGALAARVEEAQASIESHLIAAADQADLFITGLEQRVAHAKQASSARERSDRASAAAHPKLTAKQRRAKATKYLRRRASAKPK